MAGNSPDKSVQHRQNVAEVMLNAIEKGVAPWQKPWDPNKVRQLPFNPTTENAYQGMNSFWLSMQGYDDPRWMTFKQAQKIGANVNKGEKGTLVERVVHSWKRHAKDEHGNPRFDDDGQEVMETVNYQGGVLVRAVVFNAQQINGIAPYQAPERTFDQIPNVEKIIQSSGVPILHDQSDRCFYRGSKDKIHMVPKEGFEEAYEYYSTVMHEIGHATGHQSRMPRDKGPFGTEKYAEEELRAEMASYLVSTELGLGHYPERHANYVESWMKAIRDDNNALFRAASEAQTITEWVLKPDMRPELEKHAQHAFEAKKTKQDKEVSMEQNGRSEPVKTYINVPFKEKNQAKKLGAKWDKDEKSWYVEGDTGKFTKWMETDNKVSAPQKQIFEKGSEIVYTTSQGLFSTAKLNKTGTLEEIEKEIADKGKLFGINGVMVEAIRKGVDIVNSLEQHEQNHKPTKSQNHKERHYLNVPYEDKDQVKELGARWDRKARSWYAPDGVDGLDRWRPENTQNTAPNISPYQEFKEALEAHGLVIDGEPKMDGTWQRVSVTDDSKGKRSGSYRGWDDGGIPRGLIHNFKESDEAIKWVSTGAKMSEEERIELRREAALQAEKHQKEIEAGYEKVSKKAFGRIINAPEATDAHPYLQKKGVQTFGLKQHSKSGHLIVPMVDTTGHIWNSQTISAEGDKLFQKNGRKQGLFHAIGFDPKSKKANKELVIVEGYATGATIHEATGKPVAVAFDAGNLKPVAQALRTKYPDTNLTIAGDDDHAKKKNAGLTKGRDAAESVKATFVSPELSDEDKANGMTDFNDVHQAHGLEAVTATFKKAAKEQRISEQKSLMAM